MREIFDPFKKVRTEPYDIIYLWQAVFTFNPYLQISVIKLQISVIQLEISLIGSKLEISEI